MGFSERYSHLSGKVSGKLSVSVSGITKNKQAKKPKKQKTGYTHNTQSSTGRQKGGRKRRFSDIYFM